MAGHTRLLVLLLLVRIALVFGQSSTLSSSPSPCLQSLSQSSQFSKFASYLNGGLVSGLSDAIANSPGGGITIFAPTDSAWGGLSPISTTYLTTPANGLIFQGLLFSHAVEQEIPSGQFQDNQTLISLSGEPLLVLKSNGTLQVDGFPIMQPDAIVTTDCIVHGFNGIIVPLTMPIASGLTPTTPPLFGGPVPPSPAPAPAPIPVPAPQPAPAPSAFPCSTILEAAVNSGRYQQLIQKLQATGLDLAIRTLTIPVTIFAPTDTAFNATQPLLAQLGASGDILQRVLLYHVADGYHTAESLLSNLTLLSELQGLPIPIDFSNGTSVVVGPTGSEGSIVDPDMAAVNPLCVLHGISTVMIPPGLVLPGAPGPAPSQAFGSVAPASGAGSQAANSTGSLTSLSAPQKKSAAAKPQSGLAATLSILLALAVASTFS